MMLSRLLAVVDVADGDRAAGDRTAHAAAERHRRATVERLGDGMAIGPPRVTSRPWRRVGHARLADDLAGAIEGEPHRHLHSWMRGILIRRQPAGAQGDEQVTDRVDRMVGGDPFTLVRLRAVDRQLQILAERKWVLRQARLAIQWAADGRGAGPGVEHAAHDAALLTGGARRKRDRAERGAGGAAEHCGARQPHSSPRYCFASAATWTWSILSGFATGSPLLSLSTTSMPDATSPITVYWPFRLGVSRYMMKNWLLAELLSPPLRAMPTMPRLNGTFENSACRLGYFEPPVPLWFWPSPVCAMKPSITRWNGTLS